MEIGLTMWYLGRGWIDSAPWLVSSSLECHVFKLYGLLVVGVGKHVFIHFSSPREPFDDMVLGDGYYGINNNTFLIQEQSSFKDSLSQIVSPLGLLTKSKVASKTLEPNTYLILKSDSLLGDHTRQCVGSSSTLKSPYLILLMQFTWLVSLRRLFISLIMQLAFGFFNTSRVQCFMVFIFYHRRFKSLLRCMKWIDWHMNYYRLQFLSLGVISWKSKKQSITIGVSIEVEYQALAYTTQELVRLCGFWPT